MGEGPLQHIDRYAENDWVQHLTEEAGRKATEQAVKQETTDGPESNIDHKAEARMESQGRIDELQKEVDILTQQRDELLGQLKALKLMLQTNPADSETLRSDEGSKSRSLRELQGKLDEASQQLRTAEAQHRTVYGLQS